MRENRNFRSTIFLLPKKSFLLQFCFSFENLFKNESGHYLPDKYFRLKTNFRTSFSPRQLSTAAYVF